MSKIEDRELLELAAKATGIKWVDDGENGYYRHPEGHTHAWWNPITDDGDALRLAVKLELDLAIGPGAAMAGDRTDDGWGPCESYGNDPYAATRRAIVRAAAEIGRLM